MKIQAPGPKIAVLGASGVAASQTGDTNETIVGTVNIPAGVMGLNGILRISSDWQVPNNANTKTARIRLGGIAGTIIFSQASTTVVAIGDYGRLVFNRGAANSQFVRGAASHGGGTTSANITASVDTSVDQTLVFTAQCGNAADTITLQAYLIELIRQ